jgi:hypothetical protein
MGNLEAIRQTANKKIAPRELRANRGQTQKVFKGDEEF